jgi:hypothetical protein
VLLVLIGKYLYDFVSLNKDGGMGNDVVETNNILLKPRLQVENDNFMQVIADKGVILDDDKYEFYNITFSDEKINGVADKGFYDKKENYLKLNGNVNFDFR